MKYPKEADNIGAFPFLSWSWQVRRGLEQLFNLKGDDLTLSLFSIHPPKATFQHISPPLSQSLTFFS